MKHCSFLSLSALILGMYSCGKITIPEKGEDSNLKIQEKNFLTGLPENHYLPFEMNSIQLILNSIAQENVEESSLLDGAKEAQAIQDAQKNNMIIAENSRNKIYTYYREAREILKENSKLTLEDLQLVRLPKLNISIRESIKESFNSSLLQNVTVKVPQAKTQNTQEIDYTLIIKDNDGNVTDTRSIKASNMEFDISSQDFKDIFLDETKDAFIVLNDISYDNGDKNWSEKRKEREAKKSLYFTLSPSLLNEANQKGSVTQYISHKSDSSFEILPSNSSIINRHAFVLTLPNSVAERKVYNAQFKDGVAEIQNLRGEHLNLKIKFEKKKAYRLIKDKEVLFTYETENETNDCDSKKDAKEGEELCSPKKEIGECIVETTRVEQLDGENLRPLSHIELTELAKNISIKNVKIFDQIKAEKDDKDNKKKKDKKTKSKKEETAREKELRLKKEALELKEAQKHYYLSAKDDTLIQEINNGEAIQNIKVSYKLSSDDDQETKVKKLNKTSLGRVLKGCEQVASENRINAQMQATLNTLATEIANEKKEEVYLHEVIPTSIEIEEVYR